MRLDEDLPSAATADDAAVEPRAAGEDEPGAVVSARDVCGRRRGPGIPTYEYATFAARPGRVLALACSTAEPASELLRAVAGLAAPAAGSLSVDGVELVARGGARRLLRAPRLPRGTVGVGVLAGVAEPDGSLTVDEALAHEFGLWRRAVAPSDDAPAWDGDDTLAYLARFELATDADRRVSALTPAARARLSAALALVCRPRAATVDLTDPFVANLSAAEGAAFVRLMSAIARETGVAVMVGTTDVSVACAADDVVALDMTAAEELAAAGECSAASSASAPSAAHAAEPADSLDPSPAEGDAQ